MFFLQVYRNRQFVAWKMLLLFQWNMGQDARNIGSVSRTTESAIWVCLKMLG